jgi:hypothetical protein
MRKYSTILISLLIIIYLYLIISSFSNKSVFFYLIEIIPQGKIKQQIIYIYYGLGLSLLIQPIFSMLLLIILHKNKKHLHVTNSLIINIYVALIFISSFLIFLYFGITPWSIPIIL